MTNRPYLTDRAVARLRALPRNLRWVPSRPAPSWRENALYAIALVALFVAGECVIAWMGGAR